jgi:chorismate synthase
LSLSESDIQPELDRRRPGASPYVTQREEADRVNILSGVYEGKTTGTPVALLIENTGQRSSDYDVLATVFRPGHADYTYWQKYGIRDPRGGGRASARLTAPLVAAGAIAGKWLHEQYGTVVRACLGQLGDIPVPFRAWEYTDDNPFFAASDDVALLSRLGERLDMLRVEGDSIGARVDVVAQSVPVGWGDPLYAKLDAMIARAMMGINAVKGVEIGAGFRVVSRLGSENSDALTPEGFAGNEAGGILGGISTGQDIVVSLAAKPTPSIRKPRQTIDTAGNPRTLETPGRHDPCVGIRAVPVAQAMLKLVLMDAALRHRAQCADVQRTTRDISR